MNKINLKKLTRKQLEKECSQALEFISSKQLTSEYVLFEPELMKKLKKVSVEV